MIEIQNTILSFDIFKKKFVCDLCKCKGQCCIDGDSGAPLEKHEFDDINKILPKIIDYLSPKSKNIISKYGIAYIDTDGELVTSIIKGRECVFTYFDEKGICKCAIDTAYRDGIIDIQKPISCHLYPIRLKKYDNFIALNYNQWSICSPALEFGKKLDAPLYKFLKDPLIRRFGEDWYNEVLEAAKLIENNDI